MAYKFQLGAARLSGSLVQEGQIKAESAALSGSSLGVNGTAASVFGISVLGAANQSAAQNVMGLRPGTEVQAYDAQLLELATMNANTAEAMADLLNTEVQILDGATVSTAELNILASSGLVAADMTTLAGLALDGVAGLAQADFTKLAAIDATAAEINLIDGGTSRTTNVPADGDGFLHNNNGTMEMTTVDKLAEYVLPKITGGDVAVASNGTATIQATSVEGSMLNANVAGDGVTVVSNALKIKVHASGGVDLNGPDRALQIKLSGSNNLSGLDLTSNGLAVKLSGSNTGLEQDEGGIFIQLNDIAGNGIDGNSGPLSIRTYNSGGIDTAGPDGAVRIKLDTNPGLALGTGGIKVGLDSNPGLQLGAGGLKVQLNGSSIQTGGSGLSVNAVALAGGGLGEDSGALAVDAGQTGISTIYNSGLIVGYGASDATINFATDNRISMKVDNTEEIRLEAASLGVKAGTNIGCISAGALTIGTNANTNQITIGRDGQTVVVAGNLTVQGAAVEVQQGFVVTSSVHFEGATPDANEVILTAADAQGSDKTITLPDLTGHVPLLAGAISTANVTAAEFGVLDGGSTLNTGITVSDSADGFLMNDGGVMKHIRADNLKTYMQTGVTADSTGKVKRTITTSTGFGSGMTITDDGGVNYYNITASATALVAAGFSEGDEINIKAGPNVSEAIVLTISGAAPSVYGFDGFSSIQLESPNASVKLILQSSNNWMIF